MYNAVILIVDDELEYLDAITEALNEKNFKLVQALNGKMGCMVAKKFMPDIIIVDWEMPEMNGIEMIEELKKDEHTKDIPVIMCTGRMTSAENLDRALNAGAIDYLRKPVDPIELTARINSALNLSASFKKIKIQNKQLQVLNTTKNKFFGIIAHDLRNPFYGILGLTDTLISVLPDMDLTVSSKYVHHIRDTAQSAYSLLENLLHWSKSQTSKIEFSPRIFL